VESDLHQVLLLISIFSLIHCRIKFKWKGSGIKKSENEGRGIIAETERNKNAEAVKSFGHTYYQALLLIIGKSRKFDCWAPNQDKNKLFVNESLGALRTLQAMPDYSYRHLVDRSATVDVIRPVIIHATRFFRPEDFEVTVFDHL
jgi:hypothetical protein